MINFEVTPWSSSEPFVCALIRGRKGNAGAAASRSIIDPHHRELYPIMINFEIRPGPLPGHLGCALIRVEKGMQGLQHHVSNLEHH
ncbi:hypothetical protein CEXT_33911 [Caerostris extrusa]|uniref:Uncharacterized protein n=1 Tax=Caerostris extrusa TaxID=172846 RepID=A0AAV4N1K4_CAEEX|nr:hypothetical protein CEXT_33911 [Caerostris extrusa]